MKKLFSKHWKEKKVVVLLIIILLLIFFSIFGAKIWLYINFLLGNDIVVKLNADKESISLVKGQETKLGFESSVTTNPFCTANCKSTFTDISRGIELEKDEFVLRPAISLKKEYPIIVTQRGSGQEIYRFSIECRSVKTLLCHTDEEPVTRSVLVTVDYDLSEEEKNLKSNLKEQLIVLTKQLEELYGKQEANDKTINKVYNNLIVDDLKGESYKKKEVLDFNKEQILYLQGLWNKQTYDILAEQVDTVDNDLFKISNELKRLNSKILVLITSYNQLIDEIMSAKITLEYLKTKITDYNMVLEVNETIKDFNEEVNLFQQITSIEEKGNITVRLSENVKRIEKLIAENITYNQTEQTNENITDIEFEDINEIYLEKVYISESTPISLEIIFEEPQPKCYVFGKCKACCITEECKNDPSTFPVMMLHGHAVNKDVSAEYSLEGFNKIQNKMEEEGYLNAGTVTLYSTKDVPEGILGASGAPLTIRASYYFDIFKQPENYIAVQAKSENIDTYAIRLKELIDTVKYKTGKPKVKIMAFSMGGLVTRRYLQIFGNNNVEEVILIGTPNKGIVGQTAGVCPLLGEKLECRDMDSESLFINKLNNGPQPKIPIYNIVGTGCEMDGGKGDGIVLEEKAFLEGATNYIINGTCRSKIKPLHLDLRDIDTYPEVYQIIIGALKNGT